MRERDQVEVSQEEAYSGGAEPAVPVSFGDID